MKCPNCKDATLVMSARQTVEIDYCPECRGVWLDRGELDKLIDRSLSETPVEQHSQYRQPKREPDFVDSDFKHRAGYGHKKHKSWLSEIFD